MKSCYTVLIISNYNVDIKLLSHLLDDEYVIYNETDNESGFTAAGEMQPDIILLDFNLTEANSSESDKLLFKLMHTEATKDIPIIVITEFRTSDAGMNLFTLGAADYLVKPVSAYNVSSSIRNQMRIKENEKTGINHLSIKLGKFYDRQS